MGRCLIEDTNVLIAYERGTLDRAALDADELAVASVCIAGYRAGIELADTPERAADRARSLAAITSAVDVLDCTEAAAACHGRLIACARRLGTPRAANDMIIAAHAVQTDRIVLAFDAKAQSSDLPGVTATSA
ncbi:MAG TPA: type II toxin-antitoxin system VapC family toxin [Streptosporangiaceae bacterium]|nr:type II toxin-antitoxin system VapC family toxin [Streptosporangiaceae bacterium]